PPTPEPGRAPKPPPPGGIPPPPPNPPPPNPPWGATGLAAARSPRFWLKPPSYAGGRSEANSSGSTVGRGTNSGLYRSIRKLIGRPLMSAIRTPLQSSSVGFSTTAQP